MRHAQPAGGASSAEWKRKGTAPIKKRFVAAAVILGCLIAVVGVGLPYLRFVAKMIREESTSHLSEIYTQVNSAFSDLIQTNFNIMNSWRPYLENRMQEGCTEEICAYLQEEKATWGFTECFFISRDGNYKTPSGEVGYIDFQDKLSDLILHDKSVVVDATLPGSANLTVFAVPAEPNVYDGFSYVALAMSFNNRDMLSTLDTDSFDGQSNSYVVYSDGRVLINNTAGAEQVSYNFFHWLRKNSTMSDQELDALKAAFARGESGTIACKTENGGYYLNYQPVGTQGWMVLGLVPQNVVNASMNRLQRLTLGTVVVLAGLILWSIIYFLVARNRQSLYKKDMEIQYREQLFSILSSNVNDIFIMLNPEGMQIEYISPNIEPLAGISPEAAKRDIGVFESFGIQSSGRLDIFLSGIPMGECLEMEREYVHGKTGARRWFRIRIYHTSIQESEKFVFELSDRTQEKQMTQSLQQALEDSRTANREKSVFLSNMSHDIRTPINAITGLSTLLARDADKPDKVREHTRKIASSGQHLLSLISDVLDMSKIESGKTILNISAFIFPELIHRVLDIIQPQLHAKGHKLTMRIADDVPERLQGDKERISQILLNLLTNAIKYTPPNGCIVFSVRQLPSDTRNTVRLEFVVSDNGIGMAPDFAEHVFDMFARELSVSASQPQGTGLGMTITKSLVSLMGGTISVDSVQGTGTTFYVELPLTIADEAHDTRFWQAHGITRLLAVSGSAATCLQIQSAMTDVGVEVTYAANGARAVDIAMYAHACQQDFHVVLLDMETCEADTALRIRQAVGPEPPLMMLTDCSINEPPCISKEIGLHAFLPKPFFVSTFQQRLERLLHTDVLDIRRHGQTPLDGLHFLIAEDNDLNAEILIELLQDSEGVLCRRANDGREAVSMFERSEPDEYDVILMDVQMPDMNGYAATRAIRASSHPAADIIPVIAMTASVFSEDIQEALDSGMNAYISKPVDMAVLQQTICSLLKR